MKPFLIIASYLLFSTAVYSQNFEWVVEGKGPPQRPASTRIICKDSLGFIYVAGDYWDTLHFGSALLNSNPYVMGTFFSENFIVKMDQNGSVIWAVRQGQEIKGMCVDNKGGLFVTGTYSGKMIFGTNGSASTLTAVDDWDGFIAKYNTSGQFLWAKSIGGIGYQGLKDIATDEQGNVYVVGGYATEMNFNNTIVTGDFYPQGNGVLAKYDNNGNFKWVKVSKAITSSSQSLSKVCVVKNKIFISGFIFGQVIFGSMQDTFLLTSTTAVWGGASWDILLASYNTDGKFLWAEKAGGCMTDDVIGMVVDDSNGIYLTGRYDTTAVFGTVGNNVTLNGNNISYSTSNRTFNMDNVFFAKYTDDGSLQWVKDIKRIRGFVRTGGISLNDNKDIFISGTFEDTMQIDNTIFIKQGPPKAYNLFVAKFNNNSGQLNWITSTVANTYVFSNPETFELVNDQSNCYVVGKFSGKTGFGNISVEADYYQDAFVAKINDNDIVGLHTISNENIAFNVYPSPTNGKFTINYSLQKESAAQIRILDVHGKIIYTETIQKSQGQLTKEVGLTKQAKGVYFVEMISDNERMTKKIVIE